VSFIFYSGGYYYEVESYRSGQTVKKRFLRKFGKDDPRKNGLFAPSIPKNAPKALVLFAGGGGVETGMVMAGIRPVYAIEYDEKHPSLSKGLIAAHHANFSRYQTHIIEKSVASVNYAQFQDIDFCHASPVCSNFSRVNCKTEGLEDFENAIAIARCITVVRPKVFTLENVGTYANSLSLKMILTVLEQHNYQVDYQTLNMADYGVAQSRVRFWLRASLSALPSWPESQKRIGFWPAIEDIADTLSESKLTNAQSMALEEYQKSVKQINYPIAIERVGYRGAPTIKQANESFWTIRRMICTDQNDNNRSKFADLVLGDGKVKAFNIECLRRLQGFPLWYQLPKKIAVSGSLLGYSVPPIFAKQLFEKFI
jgi:DNA (cytosine-5)-methyltransferase 1